MTISAERLGDLLIRLAKREAYLSEFQGTEMGVDAARDMQVAIRELLALRQKVEKLDQYVQHKSDCGYSDDGEYTYACTCGLSAVRRLLEG